MLQDMDKRPILATHDPAVSLVQLTKGDVAIVDTCHAGLVSGENWSKAAGGYAISGKKQRMHRVIGDGLGFSRDLDIDHINGNRLDNRVSNLRPATRSQNNANRVDARGKSGAKGVKVVGSRFRACISINNKSVHLGYFDSAEAAALAYDAAAVKSFGPFATTNYPVSDLTRGAVKTLLDCVSLLMEKGRSYGNSLDGDGKAIERIDNRIREKLDRSKVSGLTGDTAMDAIGLIALRTAVAT